MSDMKGGAKRTVYQRQGGRMVALVVVCLVVLMYAVSQSDVGLAAKDALTASTSAASMRLFPPAGPDLEVLKGSYHAEMGKMDDAAAVGNYTFDPAQNKLCVVARTYKDQMSYLPITLLSLYHSGFPDTQVFLVNTDRSANISEFSGAIDLVNTLAGRKDFAVFLPFESDVVGDYGYTLTDEALQYLYDHPEIGCERVMFTNGDNFYVKDFASHMRRALHVDAEMIGFNFISRYNWNNETLHHRTDGYHNVDGVANTWEHDDGHSKLLDTEFAEYHIDLGAAVFKLSFIKQWNLKFLESTEGVGYTDRADGHFVMRALTVAKRAWLLRSVLFVHQ